MNCRKFDAVIFDFDGVLVESVDIKTRAFTALYAEYGPDVVQRVVKHHLEHGGVSRFEKFRHYHEVFLEKPLSADEEEVLGRRFARLVEESVVKAPWVRGAREFLEAFRGRALMFVVSGTPDAELKAIIERRGMTNYFVSVHGSPATKSEIIRGIIKQHHLDPGRVLVVGDTQTDYEAAMDAEASFVGCVTGESVLFPAAVQVIPDLTVLFDIVKLRAEAC